MATVASHADAATAEIARFGASLRFEDLPAEVVHAAKVRIVDTLGCAVGGADAPPARIARELAGEYSAVHDARVLGATHRTTPELAALANGIMSRYLDFNDGGGGAHASDTIAGVLAVADAFHVTGRQAVLGVIAAYEANGTLGEKVPFMKLGWDQGTQIGLGVAVGIGVVLGFDEEQLENAISIALTPSIPLRVTRSGALSMWKGTATAFAGSSAVLGALLAHKGMTGPSRPFDGRNGVFDQLSGPFEVRIQPERDGYKVTRSNIKGYPMAHMTHAVVSKLVEMTRGLNVDDIDAIEVRTHSSLIFESGGEPEKWDPQTRETADHSLPYVMAIGLRHGTVTVASFTDEAIHDPSVRPLMKKIRVVEVPEFTAMRESGDPKVNNVSELEVTTRSGQRLVARTGLPRGNHLNPMTDHEIEQKFRGMASLVAPAERIDRALAALWGIDAAPDVSTALAAWGDLIDPR